MGGPEDPIRLLEELWQEHTVAPFPDGLRGREIDGIDLVMLDADIAGCVSSYLSIARHHTRLDLRLTAILRLCYRDAGHVLSTLAGEEAAYVGRLERMAGLVLGTLAESG